MLQLSSTGIACITLDAAPAPPVNLYLIQDDPLTLIDTGPNLASSLKTLESSLQKLGYKLCDLEQIILTHQHVDHIGLASLLAQHAQTSVIAWHELQEPMQGYENYKQQEWEFLQTALSQFGIPLDYVAAMHFGFEAHNSHARAFTTTRPVNDNESIGFANRTLTVMHLPGHSPSDIALYDEENQHIFVGDIVLRALPAVATLTPRLTNLHERFPAGISQLKTLKTLSDLPQGVVGYSGHGQNIEDLAAFASRRHKALKRRAEKLFKQIEKNSEASRYQLYREFYGELASLHPYTTISEFHALLDILTYEEKMQPRSQ